MIGIARRKKIYKEFEIDGEVFAFDSTTIDLCLSVFWWAKFCRTKACIKTSGTVKTLPCPPLREGL